MAKSYDSCLSALLRAWLRLPRLLVASLLVASLVACAVCFSGASPRMPIPEFSQSSPTPTAWIFAAGRAFHLDAWQSLPAAA
jgi:hypothetical protein